MTGDTGTIDVVLRDGSTVCLRPSTADDVDALQRFLVSLSTESLYFRFLGLPALTTPRIRALLDNSTSTSVIGEAGGRIVAFAGFYRDAVHRGQAEVAFAVSDAMQGHGNRHAAARALADIARDQGIETFDAYVLGGNRRMLDVFRDSGFALTA